MARLQDEGEGGPFVLRVMGGGHLSTRRGADLVAEWQGFLLRELFRPVIFAPGAGR